MTATMEKTDLRFGIEPYSEKLIQEMRPLWDAHYEEISANHDIPLDPNLTMYSNCDKNGTLRIFTARIGAGWESTLVGYNIFLVGPNPHYQTSRQANQDIVESHHLLAHALSHRPPVDLARLMRVHR